jgi:hypothetical protein
VFEQYRHHGEIVWVRSDLKGKHRENCLCYSCTHFIPGEPENCPRANLIYGVCVMLDMVLPVWECPEFMEAESA